MKRKLLTVFLALIAALCLCFGLVACDNGGSKPDTDTSGSNTEQGAPQTPDENGEPDKDDQDADVDEDKDPDIGDDPDVNDDKDPDVNDEKDPDVDDEKDPDVDDEKDPDVDDEKDPDVGDEKDPDVDDDEPGEHVHTFTVENVCSKCGAKWEYTDGLAYELNPTTDTYAVAENRGTSGDVVIPYGYQGKWVTEIGFQAFPGCKELTSITIPNSVTLISFAAFWGCSSLKSITIPDSMAAIELVAFRGCSSLEKVIINDLSAWCKIEFEDSTSNPLTFAHHLYLNDSEITELTIPTGVTKINPYAFMSGAFTSITIPDSVTSIGNSVFEGCEKLTSITVAQANTNYHDDGNCLIDTKSKTLIRGCNNSVIPQDDSVVTIGSFAFWGCSEMTNITIPDSVTSIGGGAFVGCSSLESITVGAKNTVYHSDGDCLIETKSKTLFLGCKNSMIPKDGSVTTIGDSAFAHCTGLTSIEIPDGVTSIETEAFWECTSLASIIIPDSVTEIDGWGVFESCPIQVASIPTIAIDIIPKEMIRTVILTSGDSIDDMAFFECSTLTNITIPDSVTSIGEYAFYDCTSLKSIEIPASVASIGWGTFHGCNSLESMTLPFVGLEKDDPIQSYFDALFAPLPYSDDSDDVPESLKEVIITGGSIIGFGAFSECHGLTSIIIPDSVTSIGDWAFQGCSGLKSFEIPNGVKSIGNYAFEGCSGLNGIAIPDSVSSIGYGAFSNCSGLESITATQGNTVYHSKENCLIETKSKTLIRGCNNSVIPQDGSVVAIGPYAFYGCSGMTSIEIPGSVTSIGERAFYGCSGLTSITIPDDVTSIGQYAFKDCSKLTGVYITDLAAWCNIDFGDGYANPLESAHHLYVDNVELKELTIPNGITEIKPCVFCGCSGLTSIVIPNSVTSIGEGAFYRCSSLTSITIPDGVTSIGDSAFENCTWLTDIQFRGTVKEWRYIEKGSAWDSYTDDYKITCTDGTIDKSGNVTYFEQTGPNLPDPPPIEGAEK